MKQLLPLLLILICFGCREEKKERWSTTVRCLDVIAMPNEYRMETGFDSIQFMCRPDGSELSVNFCYPNSFNKYIHILNESDFDAFFKDSSNIHIDTIYTDTFGVSNLNHGNHYSGIVPKKQNQ